MCHSVIQVAEVVAQVLLQAQTDVLVEVAGDPSSSPQGVDSAVAQVSTCLLSMCSQQSMPAFPINAASVATITHVALSVPLLVSQERIAAELSVSYLHSVSSCCTVQRSTRVTCFPI